VSTLNVLISHLSAAAVQEQLAALRALAPVSRFVLAFGGEAAEYAHIDERDKVLLDDPALRAAARSHQSYTVILTSVFERWLAAEPKLDALYLFEFDHLILRPEFEERLRTLARATGAGFMGKNASPRHCTNWHHYTRFRRDAALLDHLARVTVRSERGAMYGTLGNGMWFTRAAVESYLGAGPHPRCYGELYVPTLLHHVGHQVVDIDAHSRLYDHVRYEPQYTAAEVETLAGAGAAFIHPVKDAAVRVAALRRASAGKGDG
jgi:hypothetical protein